MIRITVSYPSADGKRFDHTYYQAQHRQLLLDRLAAHGLQRVEMDKALADGAGGLGLERHGGGDRGAGA